MKRIAFFAIFFISTFSFAQQPGYEIKVAFKPFKNQYIYLGHYEGKQLPIIDSIQVNDKSGGWLYDLIWTGEKFRLRK